MFDTKFRPADAVVLALIAAAALALLAVTLIPARGGEVLITCADGSEARYPLGEDRTVELSSRGITLRVEIAAGEVRVAQSDCPGQDCRKTGSIRRAGDVIVCAPAGVVVRITGGQSDGIAG